MKSGTICAVATPSGTGGVGIIRISGDKSFEIASKLFTAANGISVYAFEPSKLYFGKLITGSFTDGCLCVRFAAPHSFTGEDVIEFQCHGGTALLNGVLKAVIECGARIAECGEFTKRAFINGKLDLAECEGLIDIINAESEAAVSAASALLQGSLSEKVKRLQDTLKDILSRLEVSIDYSDEDIEEKGREEIKSVLAAAEKELRGLSDTYGTGSRIKQGISVTLCGKTNVGKSSLFNSLIGYERAIVTDIAGTTRDAIEDKYIYNGIVFRLTDTAGIRGNVDVIENLGIGLSKKYIASADAVVFVADSVNLSAEDREILRLAAGKKVIKVLNKSDRLKGGENTEGFDIRVSSVTGENITLLKEKLYGMLIGKTYSGGLMLTNYRHYDAVLRAADIIIKTIHEINVMFTDMLAYNIRAAWETLGEITGETSIESVIDNIFARFCLGK